MIVIEKLSQYLNNNFIPDDTILYTQSNGLYQSLPSDTKVISSILECSVKPYIISFCQTNNFTLESPQKQNTYPDNVILDNNDKYAVDIKSTYRNGKWINGMTLGAYSGYFRDRKSNKNTLYPYELYKENIVICIIYDRSDNYFCSPQLSDNSNSIEPIIENVKVYVQPKWKIASHQSGSGNTKNIGSIRSEKDIADGKSSFNSEKEFDNFWTSY
jgi:Restriction endonuclease EcoRV